MYCGVQNKNPNQIRMISNHIKTNYQVPTKNLTQIIRGGGNVGREEACDPHQLFGNYTVAPSAIT